MRKGLQRQGCLRSGSHGEACGAGVGGEPGPGGGGGVAGPPAIDPRILVALWLYATLEGVGSARALERLCEEHHAYRWICGGVGVNHHTLSDFRVVHVEFLDQLLTQSVAALLASGTGRLNRG